MALEDLERARKVPYENARRGYVDWYRAQAGRMSLSFTGESRNAGLPLPERIRLFNQGEPDPGLLALYVQYARHQIISSSQEGEFPANLQGIWSDEIQTPWNGDWHLNAQQQLYWLVEKVGLPENHLPFLKLTEALVEQGEKTAASYYGARGWIVHTMTNPWGVTTPLEDAAWGSTTGSSAWQCHHLFEHYLYTGDRDYLAEVYPVMKGAAQFYLDMLVEDAKTGYLVTSPSSSPENRFFDKEGRECALCEGPAYDRELISSLFEYCIQAQAVLGNAPEFVAELAETRKRLAPLEIASDGRIMEWGEEYPEALIHHRHLSHLWGVYPGYHINRRKTPELARAAEKSLLFRWTTTPGWASTYRACVAARLENAGEAYGYVRYALRYATAPNFMNLAYHCDERRVHHDVPKIGTAKHQFQMDGNQANATGILLMLMDDDAWIRDDGGWKLRSPSYRRSRRSLGAVPSPALWQREESGLTWNGRAERDRQEMVFLYGPDGEWPWNAGERRNELCCSG